jgi:DNA-binding IclR family transcriptional regulator
MAAFCGLLKAKAEDRAMARNPLGKSFGLLRWMLENDHESVGVRPAAKALGLTPSGAHRLMHGLVEEGFLQREEGDTGRYMLGIEMMLMAQRASSKWPMRNVALAPMREMAESCQEAAFFNLYDPARNENIGIASVESKQEVRYVIELFQWKPLHVGAAGLAVLAFLPTDEKQRIVDRTGLAPATARSLSGPEQLNAALEDVRQRGYAITISQRIEGAVGIAAPIFCAGGRVLGSVGISMPEQRFRPDMEPRLAQSVCDCAQAIIRKMKGRSPVVTRERATAGASA